MEKKVLKQKKESKVALKTKKSVKITRKPRLKKEQALPVASSMIGLHNLNAPKGAHKKRKILGRGSSSGHGKTSTRGSKGQTSRAGRDFYLGFEGGQTPLIRRIPKRGFTSRFRKEYQIVNLEALNNIKESTIDLVLLEEKGLIRDKGKLVKILGDGEIKNAVTVSAHAFSKKAEEKIKTAGGKIEIVSPEADKQSMAAKGSL
jgi:large subunit ribosomal protein L15